MSLSSTKHNQISLLELWKTIHLRSSTKHFDSEYSRKYNNLTKKLLCLNLKCYKTNEFYSNDIQRHEEEQMDDSPVYSCKFGETLQTEKLLALAFENGRVVIQNIQDCGSSSILTDEIIHRNAIYEISWTHKQQLISASADATLRLLTLNPSGKLITGQSFIGHSKAIKAVGTSKWEPDVFASGGRDCNIILWDTRCHPSNKSNEISGAHSCLKSLYSPSVCRTTSNQIENSIISVLFCQQANIVSAGASDGLLKIWDLRKTYSIGKREPTSLHIFEYPGNSSLKGYTSMCLSPHGERVYISCLDGKIYSYHIINPTQLPVAEYFGHRPKTYYTRTCLSPCGTVLLSGSSDEKAYMWLTDSPGQPISYLTGHTDEVTCVAWSERTPGMVVTCSDDRKHRIYQLKNGDPKDFEFQRSLIGSAEPFKLTIPGSSTTDVCSLGCRSVASSINYFVSSSDAFEHTSIEIPCKPFQSSIQLTPRQSKINKNVKTPKTSESKSLLAWLSGSKTPKTNQTLQSPKSTSSSGKRKTILKRKLTDIMDGNQENITNKNKKLAVSPSKLILVPSDNIPNTPSPGVAKMLLYDSGNHSQTYSKDHFKISEESDNFTVDKVKETNISETSSVFKNKLEICSQYHVTPEKSITNRTGLSPLHSSVLTSPTANLPNFVIDGSSPHNRLEPPIVLRRRSDWLTSLSLKKTKFSESIRKLKDSPQRSGCSKNFKS